MKSRPNCTGSGKSVLVCYSTEPLWGSCRVITPNLVRSYGITANKFTTLTAPPPQTQVQWLTLAQRLYDLKPEKIILVDHYPHHGPLLQYLAGLYGRRAIPPVVVHLYGDFTLHTPNWLAVENILQKTRVQWICASDRQTNLVRNFVRGDQCAVVTSFFPVDTKKFCFDDNRRRSCRRELGLAPDEICYLYTGRLSQQKNIFQLVREFALFCRLARRKVCLVLAGRFDDIGSPFFWGRSAHGLFQAEWQALMATLTPEIRDRIRWIGFCEGEKLVDVYNGADIFVSLSTHHDEDFGMSPAEALCCGLPAILSDWGGYASVGSISMKSCSFVPVRIESDGLKMTTGDVLQGLFAHLEDDRGTTARRKLASTFRSALSIEKIGVQLRAASEQKILPFKGFSLLMKQHAALFKRAGNHGIPFPFGTKKGTFYEKIYRPYATPEI